MMLQSLTNLLELEDWCRRHPEIDEEEIVAPVFGVGLPRTGSSFLSSLMAQDPDTRFIRTWESPKPCPPPVWGAPPDPQRLAAAKQRIELFRDRYPDVFAMVPMGEHEPTECYEIMMNSFCCSYYFQYSNCTGFLDWFCAPGRDYSFGYRIHKRTLKLMQWRGGPKRWALKMPGHSQMMRGLFEVYPDARFVMTHRDPVKVIPSITNLVSTFREDYLQNANTERFSIDAVNIYAGAAASLAEFRAGAEDRFIDIYHEDVVERPLGEIRRLYRWLGWPLTPELDARIVAWCAGNPKTPYAHRFPSRSDPQAIRDAFKTYRARFFPGN
jgi:hypothetical protein